MFNILKYCKYRKFLTSKTNSKDINRVVYESSCKRLSLTLLSLFVLLSSCAEDKINRTSLEKEINEIEDSGIDQHFSAPDQDAGMSNQQSNDPEDNSSEESSSSQNSDNKSPHQNSPRSRVGNFRHIDILTFTRAMSYNITDSEELAKTEEWLAAHVDINESDIGIKKYNPNVKIFCYNLDLTIQMDSGSDLPDSEEAFLHFAEDTKIQYCDLAGNPIGDPIVIPGAPAGETPSPESRIKLYIWDSKRLVFNPANQTFRSWQSKRLISRMGQDFDGVFLDEHGPGFKWPLNLRQNKILSGGAVREFDGLRPDGDKLPLKIYNALDQLYNKEVADWLSHLRIQTEAAGKFILINPAEYYWVDLSQDNYMAAGGVTLELVHRPFNWSSNDYGKFAERVKWAVTNKVMVDLFGNWCETGIFGYTKGNYNSTSERYRMWRLASYYHVRGYPDDSGIVYFDLSFCNKNSSLNDYKNEWLPAYAYDFGFPEEDAYVIAKGDSICGKYQIYARRYTSGLVLVRPQDNYKCSDYGDSTAVEVNLDSPMRMLKADGTLASPTTSVSIRNAESVILIDK